MKTIVLMLMMIAVTGCSSNAKVDQSHAGLMADYPKAEMEDGVFIGLYHRTQSKKFYNYESKQYDFKPLHISDKLYIESVAVNPTGPTLIGMVPDGIQVLDKYSADSPTVVVYLDALSDQGVVRLDFRPSVNVPLKIITLGLSPAYYNIVADFEITYEYTHNGDVFKRTYPVNASYEHTEGVFNYEKENSAREIVQKYVTETHRKFWDDYKNSKSEMQKDSV